MLNALDLLESRGLPRQILLISEIEAETLDCFEQIKHQGLQKINTTSKGDRTMHHSRSWNGSTPRRKSSANEPGAWAVAITAMEELRRVAPYQTLLKKIESATYNMSNEARASQDLDKKMGGLGGALKKDHACTWNSGGSKLRQHSFAASMSSQPLHISESS